MATNFEPQYNDMRDYIQLLEKNNYLKKVDGADWNLEIGCLCEMMAEKKAPLFYLIK